MNTKFVAVVALAVGVVAGSFLMVQAQAETKAVASADPRIDKLLEQNEKILKNQDEMLKQLSDLKDGVLQIRRRSS